MKNFARLVRFAWPYRLRFGLSTVCALFVALFYAADIAAVYPLLKILFHAENCQTWIAKEILDKEADIRKLDIRLAEVAFVATHDIDDLRAHFRESRTRRDACKASLDSLELNTQLGPLAQGTPREKHEADALNRELQVAEASLDELNRGARLFKLNPEQPQVAERRVELEKQRMKLTWWLDGYRRAQPTINRYFPRDGFRTLVALLGLVMLGVAIKGVFLFLQEVLVSTVMQLMLFDIRNFFYRRTMALDLSSFSDQGTSELISRFTNDMESVAQGVNTLFTKVMREPLRIFSCLMFAMYLNWRLTCLALVLVPVSAITAKRAGQVMKRAVRRSLESMSTIYKILQESFQGIMVVKAFTNERRERRRFFLETKSLYKKSVKVAKIDALSDPVLELLALSTVLIALLSGSYLVLNKTIFLDLGIFRLQLASRPMEIEDLLYLYAMLAGMSDPVRKLANVHSRIQRAAAASDRICALMYRTPAVAERPAAVRLARHTEAIEFDQVVFAYNDREPVLRGLSLKVHHGETIALVGPNGCGKSTLMNLLPRFWDVQSGAIRVDGHDVRDLSLRSLRRQIGMVLQDTLLFEDTIARNIAYGNPHASRSAVIEAAQRAFAHQFINKLPNGYDTLIGERGLGLSGGQRQRIALARAMLRDPAILILDEATSAVDIQDEALIRKAIEEFAKGRTTFLITHSLSSLQFADRIVLMNAGRIDAAGTEHELRKNSSLYRKLHEIHFQRESA
jgi:ATP-binding cassette, subfamily B, bacterial MsbA